MERKLLEEAEEGTKDGENCGFSAIILVPVSLAAVAAILIRRILGRQIKKQ